MLQFHRVLAGLAIAAVAATGIALAQTPATPPPNLQQIILARQASFEMSAVDFGFLKKQAASGAEPRTLAFPAGGLALWANALPTMFPAGTGPGQTPVATEAKPEIWSNRVTFEARAANYQQATAKLAELAKANDTPGFTAQLDVVKKACDACHTDFKTR